MAANSKFVNSFTGFAEAQPSPQKKPRGSASMSPEVRERVSRAGGKAHSKAHLSAIGKLGGLVTSKDRAHMAAIGRIGGKASRG